MTGSAMVMLGIWAMFGLIGCGLVDRYFSRQFGKGMRGSHWVGVLLGPFMLSLALNLLSTWEREDRFVDQGDAA